MIMSFVKKNFKNCNLSINNFNIKLINLKYIKIEDKIITNLIKKSQNVIKFIDPIIL